MEFLTRKEVAKYLRVHERTVNRWVENGLLKAYKLGKGRTALLRFSKKEVERFLRASQTN